MLEPDYSRNCFIRYHEATDKFEERLTYVEIKIDFYLHFGVCRCVPLW